MMLKSIFGTKKSSQNKYLQTFNHLIGKSVSFYGRNKSTYLDKGYNMNPVVFSIVKSLSEKGSSVPLEVKKIKDPKSLKRISSIKNYESPSLFVKNKTLELKAFDNELLDFPMPTPNPNQSWEDIKKLFLTFMPLTGDFFLYKVIGEFKTEPTQVYVLPSHLVTIVLKDGAKMEGSESPIKGYILSLGSGFLEFDADEVIHIKTENPNYSSDGSHLYGQSRLRSALRNIQSSNVAIDGNNKTLLNSGAFGFITGKKTALTEKQATSIKSKLKDMRNSTSALGQIAGASSELNFTRISLTTDELKPFDYLMFDEKQICNVLGWDNKLLNNDSASTMDNMSNAEKRVLRNTIIPYLNTWENMLTDKFLPLFKGYENSVCKHNYSDLPEMQQDMEKLVSWLSVALRDGVINRHEYRSIINMPEIDNDDMAIYTVGTDLIKLSDSITDDI